MKTIYTLPVTIIIILLTAVGCLRRSADTHYPVNRFPLKQTQYVSLPLGSVRPAGWLKDQLRIQADALTGHLDEFWPDLIESAWKGGDGEAWERGPYYLDGLVPLAFLLDDQRLKDKVMGWIDPIIASSREDGWFGPEKNEDRWPLAVALKCLAQYYEATMDDGALQVIERYFTFLNENPPDWPDSAWRGVRAMENAVTGYWLYRRTGDPDILDAIAGIRYHSFDWADYFFEFPCDSSAVAQGRIPHNWEADGLTAHVVNVAMAVKYPGLWSQQAEDDGHQRAVYEAIRKLDEHHGQAGGRFSGDEHLSGKRPTQGTEMCSVVEYMFSLEKLLELYGDVSHGDRLELLAYNCLPGTMTPDGWAHQYDQQSNQVLVSDAEREWSTNGNTSNIYGLMPNYPCCLANMHQGWPKFVTHLWMATHDNGLAAVAYGPSKVTARVADGTEVTVTEETAYPFDGTIRLTLSLGAPVRFPIHLRIPGWANGAEIIVRERSVPVDPGTFAVFEKRWKDGELIEIRLPMSIQSQRRYNDAVTLYRGPLVLSLGIGKQYRKIRLMGRAITSIDYRGTVDWEIRPTTQWNFALAVDPERPDAFAEVRTNPVSGFPFADIGERVYSGESNRYLRWDKPAPVVVRLPGVAVPNWGMKNHSADDPPPSPVAVSGKTVTLELVPYGNARLRITEFPWMVR